METLWAILTWIVFGAIAGAIARLLVPGRQAIGFVRTVVLGIVGSLVGGFIAWIFVGGDPLQASGIIMSIVGAVIVLAIYVGMGRRRHYT